MLGKLGGVVDERANGKMSVNGRRTWGKEMNKNMKLSQCIAALLAVSAMVCAVCAESGDCPVTVLISANTRGGPAEHHSQPGNGQRQISADGRFVAFESTASDLVDGDTNGVSDVFVHDRDADMDGIFDEPGATETVRVSRDQNGLEGADPSISPSISADGRYVVFQSVSVFVDLAPNGAVYVRDLAGGNGAIVVVSVDCDGSMEQGNDPSISASGRFVVFQALDFIGCRDTNGFFDIYVHDRDVDMNGMFDERNCDQRECTKTVLVSVATDGTAGNSGSHNPPVISPDGRFVAYFSSASNLVDGDVSGPDENGLHDIFVRDRDTDENGIFDEPGAVRTRRVSVRFDGETLVEANAGSFWPTISNAQDNGGPYVAFFSKATNLVIREDLEGTNQVFVHDCATGLTRLASANTADEVANGDCFTPAISDDGRFIAFTSVGSNLARPDCYPFLDVFINDRDVNGDGSFNDPQDPTLPGPFATTRVALGPRELIEDCGPGEPPTICRQANERAIGKRPSVTPDGCFVAFGSVAKNLTTVDDPEMWSDVFVRDRGACRDPSIRVHPQGRTVCLGQAVELFVEALGEAPLAFQWRKDEVPIDGAIGATLFFDPFTVEDVGSYDVIVTNDCLCGEVWSSVAAIDYDTCPADINGDEIVDLTDLLILLGQWGPCPEECKPGPETCEGDVNCDCFVDVLDLLAMLGRWGPCP